MFKKTIFAVTALFAAFVAFQPVGQAEARVNVDIGLGFPGYYGGYYAPAPVYVPAPRYYAPRYRYRPVRRYRMTCGQVRRNLRNRGYYRIRAIDCRGARYTFQARRDGRWYRLRILSRNGRVYKARRL